MKGRKVLKKYQKPQILYEKEIQTLAAVCDTDWGTPVLVCRTSAPSGCVHLRG